MDNLTEKQIIDHVINSYSKDQLFQFILHLKQKADMTNEACDKFRIAEERIDKLELQIHHWRILRDHLESYPHLKSMWEDLLLAIKLTED